MLTPCSVRLRTSGESFFSVGRGISHDGASQLSRLFHKCPVLDQISKAKRRQTALFAAEQFARSAQFQIRFGDFESVGRFFQNTQPLSSAVRFEIADQNTKRFMRAATDTASHLM